MGLKNSIEKVVLATSADGNTHVIDITDMTPGQIEDVIKIYSSMRDEVSEITPENIEYIKKILAK